MTKQGEKHSTGRGDVGGMLRSLGGLVDFLSKIAEEGGTLERSGEIDTKGDGVRAVYGLSVRVGGAGTPRVEPFGNVKVGDKGPVVAETREPIVDVFDEEDHLLVIAEMPGVEARNMKFEVQGDVLDISGAGRDRRFQKEVLLPAAVDGARATSNSHNGVFELKLPKAGK